MTRGGHFDAEEITLADPPFDWGYLRPGASSERNRAAAPLAAVGQNLNEIDELVMGEERHTSSPRKCYR
jgi:hypothetical protein